MISKSLPEGHLAVLAEHGDEGVEDDLGLGEVCAGALDEDVLRLEADLGVVAVDDGRHGEDHALRVPDDGVRKGVPDDVEVLLQVAVLREELHHLRRAHLLGLIYGLVSASCKLNEIEKIVQKKCHHTTYLVQRLESDVLRWVGRVGEGAGQRVQVVGADGDEGALPGEVLVQLILGRRIFGLRAFVFLMGPRRLGLTYSTIDELGTT